MGRWWVAPIVVALGVVATGCQTPIDGVDEDTPPPVTLVVSETWMQNHQGAGGGGAADGEVRARIASLQEAIDRLRKETHTGWTGRQDDVTGYLSEVTGGSRPGTPADFIDDYGPALFGVDSSVLRFGEPDSETVPNITTTKATQALGEVPVLDATLVFTGRGSSAATDDLRVTGVRGRVYPGLTVSTTPTLTPEQAAATAAEQAGGTTDGTPRLVVLPTGPGVLAWEVVVLADASTGPATGKYYIDAATGDLVDVRPMSAEIAPPMPSRRSVRLTEPDPNSVPVTGKDPLGRDVTAYGLQTAQGVELTDTTTQAWDPVARTGAIQTHDATGLQNEGQLPGKLVLSPSTTITDPDAIASQSYAHAVLDYYASLGRDSWDGAGGLLRSSVHFGTNTYCNAAFYGGLSQPQMVYGGPCFEDGVQVTGNLVEPDVAGHEVTHGVTNSTAGLLYTGQSGALNESFSDYFGNVIGNLVHGNDSSVIAEDSCVGVSAPTRLCPANPDGSLAFRNLLNGNDFDQYLRILNPGERLRLLTLQKQDYGGVHFNSAIWNNALWTIRTRLAQIDGQPGNSSPLAKVFDRAVYGALATRLTPSSGFVDARAAVEQVIIDSQLDPVVLRTAREVFDAEKICTGCPTARELAGDPVSTSPQTQLHPMISGDRVVWLDLSATSEWAGHAATTTLGASGAPKLSPTSDIWEAVFAGDAIATLDTQGRVIRIDESGAGTLLDKVENADATQAVGFAGSDAGLAWFSHGKTVNFADPAGNVSGAEVPGIKAGDLITTVATGGGDVVLGTEGGRVLLWNPGQGGFRQVGQVQGAVYNLATHGGNVFVIEDNQRATLITAAGQVLGVTDYAVPFGATMSEEYVVWTEATGPLQSGVVPGGRAPYPETDLFLLSLATGKIYNLHAAPGQQGFPSISGRQLVWQDASLGGDDVFTAPVPGGL